MNIKKIINEMTLEEKAGLCSGSDFWHTKAIERLGVQAIMVSDGPHGLRKQAEETDHLGLNDSIKAVCFPAGCALAASFDRELAGSVGAALGDECQSEDVAVLLGPAVNIKRSPLCGRNFEYFSEDPYAAGEMAAAYINGVQSKQIGTSIKHYLANNQEYRRMTSSSEVDERTLREIYLTPFEIAVKKSSPWTVMCSYNKVNGEYASESKRYLTDVLRKEWGFDGFVVSDWGAVNDRVKGVIAGLDLEMPSSKGLQDEKIVAAVKNGTLAESVLDETVARILTIVSRYIKGKTANVPFDLEAHHLKAREAAGQCIVLLKNEDILPLAKDKKIAFIGEFAAKPRYQGGGSSHINSFKITSAVAATKELENITYVKGYSTEQDMIEDALVQEAVTAAKNAEIAVVFAGLPDSFESEGYDRSHMSLPNCQNHLIREIVKVQPNTVIVLHNGSPVEMPWINEVKAVLEVYLGGQAVGEATVDVLFGDVNPSGKLPETFPINVKDNPSYLYYLGEKDTVEYREGVFVGYRYYDKKDMEVLFPFGHGLSYTQFAYSNLTVNKTEMKDTDTVKVSVTVKNIGQTAGKEVIQIYVAPQNAQVIRPEKELKEFAKVTLAPGEEKTVEFTLDKRAFAYFNTQINDWYVESDCYNILVGTSSREIYLTAEVNVQSTQKIKQTFTINSTIGDVMADEQGKKLLGDIISKIALAFGVSDLEGQEEDAHALSAKMRQSMVMDLPLRGALSFVGEDTMEDQLHQALLKLNQIP